jgi:hypothetical protein
MHVIFVCCILGVRNEVLKLEKSPAVLNVVTFWTVSSFHAQSACPSNCLAFSEVRYPACSSSTFRRVLVLRTDWTVGGRISASGDDWWWSFLIWNFRRVPKVVFFLLGDSPASELYRVIPSVLDPRKCEYLKYYSLFNLIFCKYSYILYL